jgi:hypothetical protein
VVRPDHLSPPLRQLHLPAENQWTTIDLSLQVVQQHLETWLAASREADLEDDPVPRHVERAFRDFLTFGQLCFGFARCRCDGCGYEYLAAFSCRQRGLCPSCSAKYMVRTAAHLVDNVLPRVPYRQWVQAPNSPLRKQVIASAGPAGVAPSSLQRWGNRIAWHILPAIFHPSIPVETGEVRHGADLLKGRREVNARNRDVHHDKLSSGLYVFSDQVAERRGQAGHCTLCSRKGR